MGKIPIKLKMCMPKILKINGLEKTYTSGQKQLTVLKHISFDVEKGQIDRTGYFGDGSFRILCYPNPYGEPNQSLVVIFAAHDTDFAIANSFVQIAINQIAD